MPNFNENNRGNEFQPVFKETRQPAVTAPILAIVQQAKNAGDKINRLRDMLAQSNQLLTNGNLSSACRQKLEDAVKVSTAQLAQLEERLEQMAKSAKR